MASEGQREEGVKDDSYISGFCIWLDGDVLYLDKRQRGNRRVVFGEDDGFRSVHAEFEVPVIHQVEMMSSLFTGEEMNLCNRADYYIRQRL